jgi:hypothetical protein
MVFVHLIEFWVKNIEIHFKKLSNLTISFILVDGTFVTSVVKLKVLIREQFNSLLMNSSVPGTLYLTQIHN